MEGSRQRKPGLERAASEVEGSSRRIPSRSTRVSCDLSLLFMRGKMVVVSNEAAVSAFVLLLAAPFFGNGIYAFSLFLPFVTFAGLISEGATGALVRVVLSGPGENDPRRFCLVVSPDLSSASHTLPRNARSTFA